MGLPGSAFSCLSPPRWEPLERPALRILQSYEGPAVDLVTLDPERENVFLGRPRGSFCTPKLLNAA